MKKVSIALFAAMLFAACENTGSSTVGTYEKEDETTQSSEKKEEAPKEPSTRQNTGSTTSDTLRLPAEGGGVNTQGTNPSDTTQMNTRPKP